MKMTREHIIVLVVFILVLATLGSVYQFYYAPRLKIYEENKIVRKNLLDALNRVETKFQKTIPEVIVKAVTEEILPLQTEISNRSKFFNLSDYTQIDAIPENKMLRFYYVEQYNKYINELRQEAWSRNISIPENLSFGAPRPEELEGKSMTVPEVRQGLRAIRFGGSMIRLLMDNKAYGIMQVVVWPKRQECDNLLFMTTTGMNFYMTYADLVNFLEKLRTADRYFSINGLSIQNQYLQWQYEPPLMVNLLVTQASFQPPAPEKTAAAEPAADGSRPPRATAAGASPEQKLVDKKLVRTDRGMRNRQTKELTKWDKFVRFFKQYFWPFW